MTTDLVVPGLLGHLPRLGDVGELPRFPNLELMLSRAELRDSPAGYAETLFDLFGLSVPENADVPTAPVCFLAETVDDKLEFTYLLHADPVHLRPDQDRLLAFDFYHQPLEMQEARAFAEAFNRHFGEDGLQLLTPHATRWYLMVDHKPDLRTRPLGEVIGRNVDLFLPEGADARTWRGWINELQMLFHALPVNQAREARGQLPVSGVWLSGGGVMPPGQANGYERVQGDCPLVSGLQNLSMNHRNARLMLDHAPGRAVFDANPVNWIDAVTQLDQRLAQLLDGEVRLYAGEGRVWHWRPAMRRRLWRRVRPLSYWLEA